jgi:transaldolase
MDSGRWQRAANAGARFQRLLWASTGTKDPSAPDTLYVHCLAAPFTINTMPEATLEAFFDHGTSASRCRPTARKPTSFSPSTPPPGWTSRRWRPGCKPTAPRRS